MKINFPKLRLAPAALAAAAALSVSSASADTVLTTYAPGDVFIGFRQTGVTNTLVANLGSVTKFLPASLGGTWNGSAFNVTFGLIPGSLTVVDNLGADLVANFGLDWSDNLASVGSDVSWAVVGFTNDSVDNSPINGFTARTAFVTKARTNPAVQSSVFGSSNLTGTGFAGAFSGFSAGFGEGAYAGSNSTENSSVAYIGAGTDLNNWGTKININSAGSFGLGSSRPVEQLTTGTNQGPTNSVLDFYVLPNGTTGTLVGGTRTFTGGSFTLNSSGQLTYGVVPEPGSAVLLGAGAALFGLIRRRPRSIAGLN